jgi:integrase
MFRGKQRRSGLGSYPEVSVADARAKRDEERALIRKGIDPIAARTAERTQAIVRRIKTITFQECGDAYIKAHEVGWRHPLSRQNWRGSLSNWVYPIIGKLPVQDVDKPAVLRVLEQEIEGATLWRARAKTAEKVRSRIENILDWAEAREYRSDDKKNPARWRGNLNKLLPPVSKIHKKKPLAAMPYAEVPEFMKALRTHRQNSGRGFGRWPEGAVSARALEFVILTGGRRREASDARWEEINFGTRVWTVPADRIMEGIRISGMKGNDDHDVPLSPAAMAVLEEMQGMRKALNSEFIFPGIWRRGGIHGDKLRDLVRRMGDWRDPKDGRPITIHGFRSSFRTWADECTNYPDNVKEMALSHVVGNETTRAYARSKLLEKRRRLMEAWADYCAGAAITADVTPMRGAESSSIGLSP